MVHVYGRVQIDPNSVSTVAEAGLPLTYTNKSGTITVGGTAQDVSAANAVRKVFDFQNISDTDMWLNIFGNAATAASPNIYVAPGKGVGWPLGEAPSAKISVYCATTGKVFTAQEA